MPTSASNIRAMVRNAVPRRYTVSPKPAWDSLSQISEKRLSWIGLPPDDVCADSLTWSSGSGNSSRYGSVGMVIVTKASPLVRLEVYTQSTDFMVNFHHNIPLYKRQVDRHMADLCTKAG